jgi:hypothetical protein
MFRLACDIGFCFVVAGPSPASAQTAGQLTPHMVKVESVDYLGKRAIKITEDGQVPNRQVGCVGREQRHG